MGKINVLDKSIYNMIAAGEVVERPASVVKELVENAIDAGSTQITVEIKNGGMTYIRVADNGHGMDADDLKKAILPHATSKIKSKEDLDKIYTLGFRGEALASIAAVSRMEIYSKMKDASIGHMISIEGGVITEESEAGCADGTTIIVRNLFFNTPARMKFLKKDSTEAAYVTDVVNKVILGNTQVAVKYIQGSGKAVSSMGDSDIKSAIYSVYGKDYMKHLIDVSYQDDNVRVTGCIGDNFLSKPNRTYQSFFINSRSISSRIMSLAIQEAYKNTIMTGKFPFCVLNVEINAHLVDVNVHPTKMEVRFSDDRKIFDAVYWACKNALNKDKYIPEMNVKKAEFVNVPNPKDIEQTGMNLLKDAFVKEAKDYKKDNNVTTSYLPKKEISQEFSLGERGYVKKDVRSDSHGLRESVDNIIREYMQTKESRDTLEKQPKEEIKPVTTTEHKEVNPPDMPDVSQVIAAKTDIKENVTEATAPSKDAQAGIDFKIIGQIFETYIIVQKGNEMLLIDQHAAHERLYFEEILKDYKDKTISSQMLMMPYTFEFSASDFSKVNENLEFFNDAGFDIEPFGINTVIVRRIPADAGDISIRDLVLEMADKLSKSRSMSPSEREYDALHTMACKRALKGNHILSVKEMEELYLRIQTLDNINTCPHGRPIEVKMTKYQIEKQFKRIV